MKRREFITLLGSGAAAWPLAAWAQQPERMRRIGVFMDYPSEHPEGQFRNAAFLQRLQEVGWTVGRNVQIDYRWGIGDADVMRRYATELVALQPEIILASGTATVGPLLQATRSRADRICIRCRSGRRRLRREFGAAGRQCHWFYSVRVRLEREMAGVA
jgi:putative ABC transport system substrate-binding protein